MKVGFHFFLKVNPTNIISSLKGTFFGLLLISNNPPSIISILKLMALYKIYFSAVSNTPKSLPKFVKYDSKDNQLITFNEFLRTIETSSEFFMYINNSFIPMGEELLNDLLSHFSDTKNELWINYSTKRLYG